MMARPGDGSLLPAGYLPADRCTSSPWRAVATMNSALEEKWSYTARATLTKTSRGS